MTDNDWFANAKTELDEREQLVEAAKDADEWKPQKVSETDEAALSGYLKKVDIVPGKWGDSYALLIEDLDGKVWKFWASSTVIKQELLEMMPGIDSPLVIVYKGKRQTQDGSRSFHLWQVNSPKEKSNPKLWHALTTGIGDVRQINEEADEVARGTTGPEDFNPF